MGLLIYLKYIPSDGVGMVNHNQSNNTRVNHDELVWKIRVVDLDNKDDERSFI